MFLLNKFSFFIWAFAHSKAAQIDKEHPSLKGSFDESLRKAPPGGGGVVLRDSVSDNQLGGRLRKPGILPEVRGPFL